MRRLVARIRGAEATSERILKRIINKDIYQFQWLVGWLVEEKKKKKKNRLSLVNWRGEERWKIGWKYDNLAALDSFLAKKW